MLRTDASNNILEYVDDDGKYDSQDTFTETARNLGTGMAFYYFSDNEDKDGSMKTGTQKITLDGESYTFSFKKGGTKKGQGVNGQSEKKYYLGGMLLTADYDNKIEVINVNMASPDYLKKMTVTELVRTIGVAGVDASKKIGQANKGDVIYTNTGVDTDGADLTALTGDYVVVNVSGTVVKSGSKVDGDGFKVVLDGNNRIKQIIVSY